MEESTIFETHLGKGNVIVVEDKEYKLKPLSTEALPHFFKAMKAFGSGKKPLTEAEKSKMSKEEIKLYEEEVSKSMIAGLTDESMGSLKYMIEKTLEKSFPEEWKKNTEQVKEFGMKYMMVLLPKIMEINSDQHSNIEVKKKEKLIKALQDK